MEQYPTIGIVNRIDDTIYEPLELFQRSHQFGTFKLNSYQSKYKISKLKIIFFIIYLVKLFRK
jgi:hypothetical protein